MRQLIFTLSTLVLFCTEFSQALTAEQKKINSDFKIQKNKIFELTKNKNKFEKNFNPEFDKLKKIFADFEKKEKYEELTAQGNQMSYDIGMIETLTTLANNKITPDTCKKSFLLNELNSKPDPAIFDMIQKSIENLCK